MSNVVLIPEHVFSDLVEYFDRGDSFAIPRTVFDALVSYFDNKADADGDSEGRHPNKEMMLLYQLKNCKQ